MDIYERKSERFDLPALVQTAPRHPSFDTRIATTQRLQRAGIRTMPAGDTRNTRIVLESGDLRVTVSRAST